MSITTNTITKIKENHKLWDFLTWGILGLIYVLIIIMTFMKTPEEITSTLTSISTDLKFYFLGVHIMVLILLGTGFIWKRFRKQLLFAVIFLLALSSTVISSIYVVIPNIVFFSTITILLLYTFMKKKIDFRFNELKIWDWVMSSLGIVFGLWYLHWVDAPIALNALLYSPLGGVNCPTLVLLSAILIMLRKPIPIKLTTFVGALTVYFGFFGMIRLGAYVDIVLILCGAYLLLKSFFLRSYS